MVFLENTEDFQFARSRVKEETNTDDDNFSDEDQYTYTLETRRRYKPFEDSKQMYILFAIQLLKYYNEIKEISNKMQYLISTIFRTREYKSFNIESKLLHLGFFYDIILSENTLLEPYIITYKALQKHSSLNNTHAKEIYEEIKNLQEEKKKFGIIWQEKWRSLSLLMDHCSSIM